MRLTYRAALFLAALAVLPAIGGPADARSGGAKRSKVTEIIVHATGGPFCQRGEVRFSPPGTAESMQRFFAKSGTVSIHYIVGREGEVIKSVPEDQVAIHAIRHNDSAIGIELINAGDGREPYPEVQVAALVKLIKGIRERWNIPLSEVKGHEDVDHTMFSCGGREVRRKQDPGPRFPWDRFRQELKLAESRH